MIPKLLRKRFYNNSLNEEDLKLVEVVEDFKIIFCRKPYLHVKIFGDEIFFNGVGSSNLDKTTKDFLKTLKTKKSYKVTALKIKTSSPLYNQTFDGGYYSNMFNSHRKYADSFIAFKKQDNHEI